MQYVIGVGCAAAALVSSALVSPAGAAFRLDRVDLGGAPGLLGSPIFISDPAETFYQDAAGDNYPPSAADITLTPSLLHDSYIAMDSIGASTDMYTSTAPSGSEPAPQYGQFGGHFDVPGELSGAWTGGAQATPNAIFGGSLTAFFGQLTVPAGTVPLGFNIVVTTEGDLPGNSGTRSLVLNGDPNGRLCGISYLYDSTIFGDKYHMYIYEIPAPGPVVVLLGAAAPMLRRRRC